MYICLCNGFTDKQVRGVGCSGDGTVSGVYRSLGAEPKCGKCVPMVRDIVREASGAAEEALGAD